MTIDTFQKTIDIPRDVLTKEDELAQPGMLSCQGCGAALSMKIALQALGERTIVVIPACCWSIIIGTYPYSALRVPVIHVPFETAAVMASGIRAALKARGEDDITVMAWAGDGGTFDIGLQSLSGAAERNDDIIYVCYDNEAYMNTGIQRSSATPLGAWTTTTPAPDIKMEPKKDIEQIILGHHVPYLATGSVAYPDDLYKKFKKAKGIRGTRFIHILSPCPPGWGSDPADSIKITRNATKAKVYPIYEVENGKYTINVKPKKFIPVKEYIKPQRRFRSIPDELVDEIQRFVDERWEKLLRLEKEGF